MLCFRCGRRLPDNTEMCPSCKTVLNEKIASVTEKKTVQKPKNSASSLADKIRNFNSLWIFLAIPLFSLFASFYPLSYSCYSLLRVLVTMQAVLFGLLYWMQGNRNNIWVWHLLSVVCFVIALCFCPGSSPFIKKSSWHIADRIAGIILFASVILVFFTDFLADKNDHLADKKDNKRK